MSSEFSASGGGASEVAVSLISGFLGSGKTTLLNALLKAPDMADAAVIINEFGEVPLDQYFVDAPEDDIAVLANGCLCCLARDGLEDAIVRLTNMPRAGRGRLSRIFIETSGLADPGPTIQLVLDLPTPAGRLVLDRVMVTVDAEHVLSQLERHEESRRQIAFADLLVFTKADRMDKDMIEAARIGISAYNSHASHVSSIDGAMNTQPLPALAPDAGQHVQGQNCPAQSSGTHHHDGHDHHHHHATTCSIVEETPIDWPAFSRWFRQLRREHGASLLRVKGLLSLAGEDVPVALDAVHHIVYPTRPMLNFPLPKGMSKLVFIVHDLPVSFIEDAWASFRRQEVAREDAA